MDTSATWSAFLQQQQLVQAQQAQSATSSPVGLAHPSSNAFVVHGLQAHHSSRARALSAAAAPAALAPMYAAASANPFHQPLHQQSPALHQQGLRVHKRPREDGGEDDGREEGDLPPAAAAAAAAFVASDSHAMEDGDESLPPPSHPLGPRMTSLEYEQKYDGVDSTDRSSARVRHPLKKQCQKSLSVRVEAHLSSSASTSPFRCGDYHLHPPHAQHAPSASMPTSLSASPSLLPLQGAPVLFGSTFSSVGSSPMPLYPHHPEHASAFASTTPVFQSMTAMNIHTPQTTPQNQHTMQHLQLPQHSSPSTPHTMHHPFTNRPNPDATLFAFAFAGQQQQQQRQQEQSPSVFAHSLDLPPAVHSSSTFRPSSAPPTRPTLSIVHSALAGGAWHLPQSLVSSSTRPPSGSVLASDERMSNLSPPSSPVDALDQQDQSRHTTSPSHNSPSLSSSGYSMPPLQRMRSATGTTAGSGGGDTARLDHPSALSSLQSSLPPSPAARPCDASWYPMAAVRSNSPSADRPSAVGPPAHLHMGGHGHGHASNSTRHTPVASPAYVHTASVDIGLGSLFIPQQLAHQPTPCQQKARHDQEGAEQIESTDHQMEF